MTWVVPLALGGVAIIVMAVFTMLSAHKRHRAIVAPAKTAGPRVLVHDINDDRCTGCDACVSVCPTNVLDLVANKSRVLRFHDCIQCEACMFACPTEALVMFPEGGIPPVLKVPEIDENFQTAVKGQYLIGEVAGKPLVKNAANLGRAVIEHMLATGLQSGALGAGETNVDVAIIGSGPGGLSAALTCIQKGLSYVVLEKEQMIASTISRYPKGKLVMAEPYDTSNLSLLPVFDSGKEQLIPIWREVIERVGMTIKLGESVETVALKDGVFDVKTTVAAYRAQRTVLSIGTRGKPRTLQVPGENMPKVYSLLEDPDDWKGKAVLVVGGGDSACEAALALADAGAKVMISYRGKGFNRAAPKNKTAIEGYAAQSRIKSKLGSQILNFEADSVTLSLADGTQKRYPNDATFVLIGADPPVQWLEKMGVKFVERPHQYQLGKSDDMVRRFVARAVDCPEDGARAAAQVLGGSIGIDPPVAAAVPAPSASAALTMAMAADEAVSGPRKWLRSATSIFSTRSHSGLMQMPPSASAQVPTSRSDGRNPRARKFDAPVPLSEFAKRGKTNVHSHNGRRDALSAGERTRILRMLRDEGGRMADEDSRVDLGAQPGDSAYRFDLENDSPPPGPMPVRADVPAKQAVVVGLAQAQAARTNNKRPPAPAPAPRTTAPQFAAVRPGGHPLPPPQPQPVPVVQQAAPPPQVVPQPGPPQPPPARSRQSRVSPPPPPPPSSQRRPAPVSFGDEPTRQVDDALLSALRSAPPAKAAPRPNPPPPPKPTHGDEWQPAAIARAAEAARPDEPTRIANIGARYAEPPAADREGLDGIEERTRPADDFPPRRRMPPPPPPAAAHNGEPEDSHDPQEATRIASLDSIAAMERARNHYGPANDERTRAVNIRDDPSISDIDWDLD